MSILTANFTSSIDIDNSLLTITDSSTEAYGNQVVTSRAVTITKADGTITNLNFPIINGVGDTITYAITKDVAITVQLSLTVSTVEDGSTYTKERNLLLPGRLTKKLTDLRKEFFLEKVVRKLLCDCHENLKQIELIEACLLSAKALVCINISSAQEALDLGHELTTIYVFD